MRGCTINIILIQNYSLNKMKMKMKMINQKTISEIKLFCLNLHLFSKHVIFIYNKKKNILFYNFIFIFYFMVNIYNLI